MAVLTRRVLYQDVIARIISATKKIFPENRNYNFAASDEENQALYCLQKSTYEIIDFEE